MNSTFVLVCPKKSTVGPEWPKRLSMENENFSIQEFESPGNFLSRSPYIKYDFKEFLKEREPIENDTPISYTVHKIANLPSEGKLTFYL